MSVALCSQWLGKRLSFQSSPDSFAFEFPDGIDCESTAGLLIELVDISNKAYHNPVLKKKGQKTGGPFSKVANKADLCYKRKQYQRRAPYGDSRFRGQDSTRQSDNQTDQLDRFGNV
jgi:hypothetical protein